MGSHFTRSSQRNNAHEPHSLDEVAGAFVREALFPSSRQIYKTGQQERRETHTDWTTEDRKHSAARKRRRNVLPVIPQIW